MLNDSITNGDDLEAALVLAEEYLDSTADDVCFFLLL